MRMLIRSLFLLLACAAAAVQSAPVTLYQNTDTDTFVSAVFSTGGYTQIGDRVQLVTGGRVGRLQTQFFNGGTADATFDATMLLYSVSGSSYSQIGSAVQLSNLAIGSGQVLNVDFDIVGGVDVPDDLVVMFAVGNVSADGDIGLNFFDPPSLGQSQNTFFLTNDGSGIVESSTLMDLDNLYLRIETVNAVSEPATAWLVLLPLAALTRVRRRRAA